MAGASPAMTLRGRAPVELLFDPTFMAVAVIGVCLLGISKAASSAWASWRCR
jgi:hypothetical protein